jgi:hypothetical protein
MKGPKALFLFALMVSLPASAAEDQHPFGRQGPLAAPSLTGWNIDVVDIIESGPCYAVEISDDLVFAPFGATLSVLDISEPSDVTRIGYVQLSGGCGDMARSGDYLYCTLEDSLQIVDISNPTAPAIVGSLPADGGVLAIAGNFLYQGQGSGFRVLDISTPTMRRFDFKLGGRHALQAKS